MTTQRSLTAVQSAPSLQLPITRYLKGTQEQSASALIKNPLVGRKDDRQRTCQVHQPTDEEEGRSPQCSDLPTQPRQPLHLHLICIAYLTLAYTHWEKSFYHGLKRGSAVVVFAQMIPWEQGLQSKSTQPSLPSRKTRPQSDHSDAGRCRSRYSGMDDQLNKATVTSCTRPDRGKIPKCFQETVLERFRLIACKSCTMNVKLHHHHINELSEAWSEFPQKRTFPLSQNTSCFV